MNQQFLLDFFDPTGYVAHVPKEVAYVKRNMHSKRFLIDPLVSEKINALFVNHPELYETQRRFAKPPFESCFIQFQSDEGSDNDHGILWAEGRTVLFVLGHAIRQVVMSRLTCDVLETGLRVRDQRQDTIAEGHDENKAALTEIMIRFTAMAEVLWLLMHQPGLVKAQEVKGRQRVVKGKLRPARAHTILTIDLAARDIVKRLVADGSRGSGVREHEVRGTWVHLNHNRRCVHQWEQVQRPEGKPERWVCPCCSTMRVWRKDHVRGDATRGNKFHTYEVKDSRLEKAA